MSIHMTDRDNMARRDPKSLWSPEMSVGYETANYSAGLTGYVMRKGHMLLEQDFGPEVHFHSVVEVGAGPGIHLDFVRHTFSHYLLTDASKSMIHLIPAQRFRLREVELQPHVSTRPICQLPTSRWIALSRHTFSNTLSRPKPSYLSGAGSCAPEGSRAWCYHVTPASLGASADALRTARRRAAKRD